MKRDENGKVKDSVWTRIKSWWLGRQLRKGKLPRGRMTAQQAQEILRNTFRGVFPEMAGCLSAKIYRADGTVEDLGLVSVKLMTTAFRDYIVDSLQNSTTSPLDVFQYHASGTSNTAEANTDTTLGTEVESRQAGTQTEGASANIYRTVATISYTATRSIVEHGIFSASSGGTLMDRSVFAAINVVNGDSIQFTYEATFNAEV